MKDHLNKLDSVYPDPIIHVTPPIPKHAGPGIASFIISLVALTGYLIGYYVISNNINTSGITELTEEDILNHSSIMLAGLTILISLILTICSLILSIIGISLKNRKRRYAVLGLVIAAIPALLFMIP